MILHSEVNMLNFWEVGFGWQLQCDIEFNFECVASRTFSCVISTKKRERVVANKVYVFSMHINIPIVLDSRKLLNIWLQAVITCLELESVVHLDLRYILIRFRVLHKLWEVVDKRCVGDDLLLVFKRLRFHDEHDY